MRKVCLFALLALTGAMPGQAQVFEHLYGSVKSDLLHDGHTTALGGVNGHFLAALHSATPALFSATRTSTGGTPSFNNLYQLSDVTIPPGSGLRIQEVRSSEIANGSGYGLAGAYVNGSSTNRIGVFYQKLDQNGNLVAGTASGYFMTSSPGTYSDVHVKKIISSQRNPDDLYILGALNEAAGGYSRVFVLRINQNGGLTWSRVYRLDFSVATSSDIPFDIVESKQKRNNVFELIVVGGHTKTNGGPSDGFLLRIDEVSGNMLNPVQFYGAAATSEGFTCIKTAANTLVDPAGAGYVIGGTSSGTTPSPDFWFAAVNQAGTVSWTKTFNYNGVPGSVSNDYCQDLIEYRNGGGAYEYYLAGYTSNGLFGSDDMMVIHTDQNGNALANGQFTYGTADLQRCVRIDEDKTAGKEGIALYGYNFRVPQPPSPLGGIDECVIKVPFNGSLPCDNDLRNAIQAIGPGFLTTKNNDNLSGFTRYTMYSKIAGTLNDLEVCSGCADPKPPLVAHWNFTNGSLVDPVNGLTGTIFGGVTPAAGMLGTPNTAFRFNGTNGYIRVPSNPVLDLQSWTLTALVKPMGFYSGVCQDNAIIWRGTQYTSTGYGLMIFDNATDNDCFTYTPTGEVFAGYAAGTSPTPGSAWLGTTPCVSNPCVNLNQWYCAWLSYDGVTGNLDLYVDGIHRANLFWPNFYGPPAIEDLFIGSGNDHVNFPYYFNGIIDDVAIYGGPLKCPLDCDDARNGLARPTTGISPKYVAAAEILTMPNPTSDKVELTIPKEWAGSTLSVVSATGQELERRALDIPGKVTVDLSRMAAGLYLLRIQHKDQYTVKKVVRQ
jgi:hypothetical protein